jgi:hypothetical protein
MALAWTTSWTSLDQIITGAASDGGSRSWTQLFEGPFKRARKLSPIKYLSVAAVVLAFVDTFIHPISLTALGLLLLAGMPWLIPLVRSPNWPLKSGAAGSGKVEFRDLKEIGEQAASAGLLQPTENKYPFQAIFDQDPTSRRLACALS